MESLQARVWGAREKWVERWGCVVGIHPCPPPRTSHNHPLTHTHLQASYVHWACVIIDVMLCRSLKAPTLMGGWCRPTTIMDSTLSWHSLASSLVHAPFAFYMGMEGGGGGLKSLPPSTHPTLQYYHMQTHEPTHLELCLEEVPFGGGGLPYTPKSDALHLGLVVLGDGSKHLALEVGVPIINGIG